MAFVVIPLAGAPPAIDALRGARPVANRGNGFGSSGGDTVATAGTCRIQHPLLATVRDLRVLVANFNGIAAGANPIDVKVAIEGPNAIYPAHFAARRLPTIEPGGVALSDPVGAVLSPGPIYSRTFAGPTGGTGTVPVSLRIRGATYGEGRIASTDTSLVDGGVIGNLGNEAYSPLALVASMFTPSLASIALVGDSILRGQGDQTDEGAVDDSRGFANRALSDKYGLIQLSRGGLNVSERVDPTRQWMHDLLLASCCDFALSNMAINDLRGSRTLAQIQADLITYWSWLADAAGCKVVQTTPTPNTDGDFTTVAGQTKHLGATAEGYRTTLADWERDGAPLNGSSMAAMAAGTTSTQAVRAGQTGHPLHGVFELGDIVETARNSGIFKANYSVDGLHLAPTGAIAAAAGLAAAAPTLFS